MHECRVDRGKCGGIAHHFPGDTVLDLGGVSYRYPSGVLALEHINLKVKRHSNLAVIGPNGGGKTTLLKLILGILRPTAGQITVMGAPPHRACRHLGYVPQHTTLRPDFPVTVREVVLMGCVNWHFLGWHRISCRACARSILEEMDIWELRNRPFCKLSGGQRQRVLIARALVAHPQLLLLDEPLANVDPASRARFKDFIFPLSQRMTVITVSHDLGLISDDLDEVLFVNRRARSYLPDEIRNANVSDLYRGQEVVGAA